MYTILPGWLIVLAQQSSNSDTFMQQLFGLIALVCALTILWLGLMYAIIRRSNERRKAAKEGRPIPPPLYISVYRAVRGLVDPQWAAASAAQQAPATPARSAPIDAPLPDLDLLMGDLPQPDFDALLGELDHVSPAPIAEHRQPIPAPAPQPVSPAPEAAVSAEVPESPEPDEDIAMTLPPDQNAPSDSIELLRVYRDLSDGSLIVYIGGRHFRALADLRGTDLERRFLNVLRDLNQMARASFSSAARHAPPKTAGYAR